MAGGWARGSWSAEEVEDLVVWAGGATPEAPRALEATKKPAALAMLFRNLETRL
jgi:hypothetical protein